MCLIVFSYKQHPQYPLIFATNRDEHYDRPSQSAQFWNKNSDILAGKDLRAGGTWMGINKKGEFSAVTNYRDPDIEKENPPSRGKLVLNFLQTDENAPVYLSNLQSRADQYMGFNLLAGSLDQLGYYSNLQDEILFLDSGLYGLSNHLLETSWPKVRLAKRKLQSLINDTSIAPEHIFDLLADDREAPDEELPDTGIPKEVEKKVSPIFIKSDGYGTRCSTVLLIDDHGEVTFAERRFKPGTMEVEEENQYQFSIEE
ncbi:NRDE family protein [Fodinibius sp.]|uniref:NRDE family protein n=1 Tax=Fodinibius sp. TaxID=1872440 RepID=UPI002ACF066A|nr:NRDE family protein [Fodinibius sp.]MDZ7658280.1 NRDE family protein [Fodinibius sp.]